MSLPLNSQNEQAAFEHHGQLVPRNRFYEIACDPKRSVAVEACAGAGKTWMLVSRMVRALLEGCAPQEILAITFTKKAAGEMRLRLQQWLLQFSTADDASLTHELAIRGFNNVPTPDQLRMLRGLHRSLLQEGRTVQIRTFHSWFAALLRSAPLSALQDLGLPGQYELLENDAKAVAQVWRSFQQRVVQDPEALADYRDAVATYGRHQTHKALESALAKRVEFALAEAHGVVDLSVQHFTSQFSAYAGLAAPADRLQGATEQALLWSAARLLGASTLSSCVTAGQDLERALTEGRVDSMAQALLTQKGTARKLSDKLKGIETVREAQELLIELGAVEAQHTAWLHQQRMARLARGLMADFAQLKRERGWVDMGDLERAALALMSDTVLSGWVQEKLDARVRHLLIDEFQDTNPLQWQALRSWLEGYTGAGQAPSVFVVGDPKQSIYRFRRAEPQVFQAAKEFVATGLGGDLLSCDHTRRNAPAILAVVNQSLLAAQAQGEFDGFRCHTTESSESGQVYKLPRLMRGVQSDADGEVDSTDTPAEAAVEGLAEGVWRNSLTTPRRELEETRKALECRQAAQWLQQQLQAPGSALRPKDIMVLARKRERLGLMQAELAALNIAAQQPEKTDLADRAEVQDLIALVDVLVSPAHDLSLARVLKSPLFGADDAAITPLALRVRALQRDKVEEDPSEPSGVARTDWSAVLHSDGNLPAPLPHAARCLALWRQWVQTLAPHEALSNILEHGDVLARYAAAAPAVLRAGVLANLQAVLACTLQIDGGRYLSAYTLVRALRAGDNPAPVKAEVEAVRLLTVHGAKGLEAPLVLLLDTDGEAPKSETMGVLVDWPGEHAYPQRFVFLASESRPPACVAPTLQNEQTARRREELNGMYVALTRTQRTLVLSSLEPHAGAAQSWWQRLEGLAQDAPWFARVSDAPIAAGTGAHEKEFLALNTIAVPDLIFRGKVAREAVEQAWTATKTIAIVDSVESRSGQAMHRFLEWTSLRPSGAVSAQWTVDQTQRIAQEFSLDAVQIAEAQAAAATILQGEGAWAWDTAHISWHGNEVALTWQGRLLRIDRLVQRRATSAPEIPCWWVFDYKTTAQPQAQPELCAQLASYRAAVARANPGQAVRAAFLTAQGALIELAS